MDVFVFEWIVPNSLQSNRFELVFQFGGSYVCFFENSASHLDFRLLGGSTSDSAYQSPSARRFSEYTQYKKRMNMFDATRLRRMCFIQCLFHARERLLLRIWRPTKHSEANYILSSISKSSHQGSLDQSWSLVV